MNEITWCTLNPDNTWESQSCTQLCESQTVMLKMKKNEILKIMQLLQTFLYLPHPHDLHISFSWQQIVPVQSMWHSNTTEIGPMPKMKKRRNGIKRAVNRDRGKPCLLTVKSGTAISRSPPSKWEECYKICSVVCREMDIHVKRFYTRLKNTFPLIENMDSIVSMVGNIPWILL